MAAMIMRTVVGLLSLAWCGMSIPLPAPARVYYIQAEETVWNYTPLMTQQCQGRDFNDEEKVFVANENGFIGSVYKKAVYRGYTDATFTKRITRKATEAHLGLLGDPIYAVVGEVVRIVFRNSLPFEVNMRPGSGIGKILDGDGYGPRAVAPNTVSVYDWYITDQAGPGPNDPSSVMWLYRSTVDSKAHTNAGLLGPIIISRWGTTFLNGKPNVDTEIFNVFFVSNENESPYLDENYASYADKSLGQATPVDDPEFQESNLMHSINGHLYCNGPTMKMTAGLRTRWYVASVGTEVDLHTPHWHGNLVKLGDILNDVVELLPAVVRTLDMIPDTAGKWLYHCHVHDHLLAGMITTYTVTGKTKFASTGRTRTYYIAADEVEWDYAPLGQNGCENRPFNEDESVFAVPSADPARIGSKYRKAIYRQYTDATFTKLVERRPEEAHLGLMGPVIRAEVGDLIVVNFKNNAKFPASIHPHGVQYLKNSEGAPYNDGSSGADLLDNAVPTGSTVTYTWNVPERAGPSSGQESSSIVWLYHSHVDEIMDVYAGLSGFIVITAKGAAKPDAKPKGVDREVFAFFQVFNENMSWYLDENIQTYLAGNAVTDEDDFFESNLMHTINGYMYCNMPKIEMKVGESVRWYVIGLGTEVDLHAATWEGQTVTVAEHRADHAFLLPSTMITADHTPDACGSWEFYCQIHDHLDGGMITKFDVLPSTRFNCLLPQPPVARTTTRNYFIAAEKIEWDFLPSGINKCNPSGIFSDEENVFVQNAPDRIGHKYLKTVYREYTDASFSTRKPHDPSLGYLGPTIKAEVGDTIRVTFKNKLDFSVNMRPQGLQFQDGVGDAEVLSGQSTVYVWKVPVRSGPADSDLSTIAWKYQSTIDDTAHQNGGLVGLIVIARNNVLDANNKPYDVDRELVLGFSIVNENNSPLLAENIAAYTDGTVDPADGDFQESNLKHSINGLLYCNLEVSAKNGEKVRWYLLSVGSELDLHGVAWRDFTTVQGGMRSFATPLIAGETKAVDMKVDHAGKTVVRCDVYDHSTAGMTGIFNALA